MIQKLLLVTIWLYQHTLSPDHGPLRFVFPYGTCRFYPTCSTYAYQAIQKHGSVRGGSMALRRILQCHPWHPGGHDPVPR